LRIYELYHYNSLEWDFDQQFAAPNRFSMPNQASPEKINHVASKSIKVTPSAKPKNDINNVHPQYTSVAVHTHNPPHPISHSTSSRKSQFTSGDEKIRSDGQVSPVKGIRNSRNTRPNPINSVDSVAIPSSRSTGSLPSVKIITSSGNTRKNESSRRLDNVTQAWTDFLAILVSEFSTLENELRNKTAGLKAENDQLRVYLQSKDWLLEILQRDNMKLNEQINGLNQTLVKLKEENTRLNDLLEVQMKNAEKKK